MKVSGSWAGCFDGPDLVEERRGMEARAEVDLERISVPR
jgi:hypothetical protein